MLWGNSKNKLYVLFRHLWYSCVPARTISSQFVPSSAKAIEIIDCCTYLPPDMAAVRHSQHLLGLHRNYTAAVLRLLSPWIVESLHNITLSFSESTTYFSSFSFASVSWLQPRSRLLTASLPYSNGLWAFRKKKKTIRIGRRNRTFYFIFGRFFCPKLKSSENFLQVMQYRVC